MFWLTNTKGISQEMGPRQPVLQPCLKLCHNKHCFPDCPLLCMWPKAHQPWKVLWVSILPAPRAWQSRAQAGLLADSIAPFHACVGIRTCLSTGHDQRFSPCVAVSHGA